LSKRIWIVMISAFVVFCLSFPRLGAGFAFGSVDGFSGTNVGGPIGANTTWTLSGSPYVVSADVLVRVNISLTIEPGVVVRFANGTSIIVDGGLIARGNSSQMITFTSNASSPAHGDWGSIRTRIGGHLDRISWAVVEYSAQGVNGPADSSTICSQCVFRENNVGVSGSNVNLTGCIFRENGQGVNVTNVFIEDSEIYNNTDGIFGSGAVKNVNVWNNSGVGIGLSGGGYPSFVGAGSVTNCSIYNNGGYGVVAGSVSNSSIHDNSGYGITCGSISNCLVFNNNEDGIARAGSVANCSIYNNKGNGIYYSGEVVNCSIWGNHGNGVMCRRISDSVVLDNKGTGVILQGSDARISRCTIQNNLAGGIKIYRTYYSYESPSAVVEDAQIRDNLFGICLSLEPSALSGFRNVIVSNCSISHNLEDGIMIEDLVSSQFQYPGIVTLRVLNTVVDSNSGFGISLNTTILDPYQFYYFSIDEVRGCTISNNVVGVFGSFGSITGSTIVNNTQEGLEVFGLSGGINQNNIYGNGIYNIRNHIQFGQDVNATMNWWGTTNKTLIETYVYDYNDDYNLSTVVVEPFSTIQIPEFPSFLALPLFMAAMLLAVIGYRKKRINVHWS